MPDELDELDDDEVIYVNPHTGHPSPNRIKLDCDRDQLESLYWDDKLTQREIADQFDVSKGTIRRRMNEWDIETRLPGEAARE